MKKQIKKYEKLSEQGITQILRGNYFAVQQYCEDKEDILFEIYTEWDDKHHWCTIPEGTIGTLLEESNMVEHYDGTYVYSKQYDSVLKRYYLQEDTVKGFLETILNEDISSLIFWHYEDSLEKTI
mgnify:CR=1 FL=1